jgi:hypothetical protein
MSTVDSKRKNEASTTSVVERSTVSKALSSPIAKNVLPFVSFDVIRQIPARYQLIITRSLDAVRVW